MRNAIRVSKFMLALATLSPAFALAPTSCWLKDAASPAPGVVYTICEQGAIYASHDNAASWKMYETHAKQTLRAVVFFDTARGLIVGDRGLALATTDGGKTWAQRDTGSAEHLLTAAHVGEKVWAAGYDGALLYSPNAGASWVKQASGTTQAIESLYFADAAHGWAAGWSGTILRTTDGGANWQVVNTGASSWSLTSIYFKDLENGWAVGFAGQLLRSTDGGASWAALTSPSKDWLKSVATDAAGRAWAVTDEQLLSSGDGGDNWKAVPAAADLFLNKVLRVGDSLWAMGQLGAIRRMPGSAEWTQVTSLAPAGSTIPDDLESAATHTN